MKRFLRKIHLWLSVPFGLIISLCCFTGGCLIFEKEITAWMRSDLYYVEQVGDRPLPLDSLIARVSATLPDTTAVQRVTVPDDKARCYEVALTRPRRATLLVDPYTAQIKGRAERLPFFHTVFRLHRWLLGPAKTASGSMGVGKWLVGASTLALVIILLTGLLMWLTNHHRPLREGLKIHFTKGWPRFWHDLHVAGGIYATVLLLAMALTGLTWSFAWYRTGFYAALGAPSAPQHEQAREARPQYEQAPKHDAQGMTDDVQTRRHNGQAGKHDAQTRRHNGQARKHDTQTRRHDVQAPKEDVQATRHEAQGKKDAADDRRSQLRKAIFQVHTGEWGGTFTRWLWLLAALLGGTLPLTGYYLWLRRLLNRRHRGNARQEAA